MRLKGRVAIITGSTGAGIGNSIARRLAQEGAAVVLNGRNEIKLKQSAREMSSVTGEFLAVQADVSRSADVSKLIRATIRRFNRIDILVNNVAGGNPGEPAKGTRQNIVTNTRIEDISGELWDRVLQGSLKTTFICCRAVIPCMKEQRSGRIINISSQAARVPGRMTNGAYVSAKAGVLGLTRQLAFELAPWGINCNAIVPGIILTEPLKRRISGYTDEQNQRILRTIPMGRLGKPEEIAGAAAFLASDDASYITGVAIDVNGGSYFTP